MAGMKPRIPEKKASGRKPNQNRDSKLGTYKKDDNRRNSKFAAEKKDDFRKIPRVRENAAPKVVNVVDESKDIPMLEGRNPVIEALKAGRTIEKLLIAKGAHEGSIRQVISMAREKGIVISEVDRVKLDSMSETGAHQGVIAIVSPYSYVEVDDLLNIAYRKGEVPFIIVLDEINDPHNLGSILRTANAAGAHGVIISKRRAVGLTPTVAKASAGAVEYVKVAKAVNISQTLKILKEKGLWVVGADMNGEKMYFDVDLTIPVALVVGSEGEGIGKLVKENCDFLVKLPMKGEISSLNAGVAGSVLMYEVLRQRILKE